MHIRRERPEDAPQIALVHEDAFPGDGEARLVTELWATGAALPELCFVAVIDDELVGHVCCSRGYVGDAPAVGLGPVGVYERLQGNRVGSALMHACLGAADARNEPFVALLGNPDFYGRFGFVASTEVGIAAPDAGWGKAFQIRPLSAFDDSVVGTFAYAPPFDGV